MNMIVVATDSDRETIEISCDARHVCPNVFSELIVLQDHGDDRAIKMQFALELIFAGHAVIIRRIVLQNDPVDCYVFR